MIFFTLLNYVLFENGAGYFRVLLSHLVTNWCSLRHCSVYKQTSHNLHFPTFVLHFEIMRLLYLFMNYSAILTKIRSLSRLRGLFQSCTKVEYQRGNLHWRFQELSCFSRNQKAGCQTRTTRREQGKSFEGKQLCFPSTCQMLFLQMSIESCSPAA